MIMINPDIYHTPAVIRRRDEPRLTPPVGAGPEKGLVVSLTTIEGVPTEDGQFFATLLFHLAD